MRSEWADAATAFGADLDEVLAEDAANLVFSPSSVAGALRMAWYGAHGRTAAELARALHLEQAADQGPAAGAGGAGEAGNAGGVGPVTDGRGNAVFRAPVTAWVQAGFPVRPGYAARVSHLAGAVLASADFAADPEQARAAINDAIAGQTAGKITGLLPPGSVTALTRLLLASAVYLKAAWAVPFPADATDAASFYPQGPDRPGVTVPVMRGTATRDYLRGDGYQAVLLPYRDIGLTMAVLLPDGPLAALRHKAAAAGLAGLLAGAARHQVTLALPRFRLRSAFDLVPALRRLGVTEAFGPQADFGGITGGQGSGPLHIGAVAHQAYIDVDEHGTEAAAATGVAIAARAAVKPPPPVTMIVDRPFLFAILDLATGLPVFQGHVSQPVRDK